MSDDQTVTPIAVPVAEVSAPDAPFVPSNEVQSAPLVGFEKQAPVTATKGVKELRQIEADAKVVLCDKMDLLEAYVEKLLVELNTHEAAVVADGRSVVDNILGMVKRAKAGLAK